jgi:glutaredoxin
LHRRFADVTRSSRSHLSLIWTLCAAVVLWPMGTSPAIAAQRDATSAGGDAEALVVFVRTGCPHCADAKVFLAQLARERPSLRIVYRPIDEDPAAAEELVQVFHDLGMWPPGVPTFVIAGDVIVGFDDAEHTGAAVRDLVDARLPAADGIATVWFGTLSASRLGLPLFTVALGLLDGFNPCAMWVLLFLLSLLVRLRDRRRMALIAGTFVLVSGAVYYAFMAAWLNVFLVVGMSTPLRWALAAVALVIGAFNVKDFLAWGRGYSFSIPASAKPGLYARARGVLHADALPASLAAVAALAVAVNVVELLCTAGLPALYTAVLTQHDVGASARYAYLGLYILGYVADDSIMVGTAVMALGSRKLSEHAGRRLKLLSGVVMIALGTVMLLRPEWLT